MTGKPTSGHLTSGTVSDYGHFDLAEGCFVLTNPNPPRKWVNLHYNQPGNRPGMHEVYAETTCIGDGPIVVRDYDGNTCQLVGYDSKFLYVRDDETNVAFSPFGQPVPTAVSEVSCRYHPHMTVIRGTCAELRVTQRVFVPKDEVFEAWTVHIENLSSRVRTVSVFAYAMFQLTGQTWDGKGVWKDNASRVLPECCGVLAVNRDRSVPNRRFNGYLCTLNRSGYVGSSGYRDHFTRMDFSLSTPRLMWGWNADNKVGWGGDVAGCVQVRVTLPPRSTARVDFLLGQAADEHEVAAVCAGTTPDSLDRACREQAEIEQRRAAAFTIDTGHPDQDAVVNLFAKKQMVSYLINKSGFRDNVQNDMGLAMCDYPMARENLLRALSSQFPDGKVPHSFRPLNLLQYADKPAWILQAVPWMLKESGDFALLDEQVPYFRSSETGTVWDHVLRTMRYLARDVGANGLCDQHFADWDDGLEPSEKTGARESVMVTQQFCLGLLEVAELAEHLGRSDVAVEARDLHAEFTRRLNTVAWDGKWYRRTLCESGYHAGSDANDQGKVFMYCQAWAVLSRTAPGERARMCMQAVDEYCENEIGFALIAPPFSHFDERIGKISAVRPGYATNGGSYCHAVGFKTVADCMLGRADEAWRSVRKTMPDSPWNPLSRSLAEPFSFTNCYDLFPERYGISQYPWRTGTASWFCMAIVEWILGVRRGYRGLLIDPCLTSAIPRARVTRTFRGATFDIHIDNTAGRARGTREIRLSGELIQGNTLPDLRAGHHRVDVVI
jgi:cellobiose phosphorylase